MHLRAAGCGGRTAASPRCQSSSSASTSSSAQHQPQIPLPAAQKQQQQRDQAHTTPLRVSTRLAAVASPDRSTQQAANYHDVKAARLITAIKTPYLPSGSFDLEAFDRLVLNQIEHGVEGLIIGGTTGEGHLMSWDEHIMLIAHTVLTYRDRLLVIGNTGSNATKEAVHATAQGFNVGMHASLQVNPYYGKTSSAGLLAHFGATLALGPGMVYNVPGRTGQDIPDDVILRLAGSPNFLGVKECTGNNRIASYADKGVTCWSGNDDEAHAGRHQYGAQGVVSVASNLIPGLYAKLMKERDDELMDSLQDLVAWLFCEPNPIGLDTALMMCGLVQPVFRLPYVPLDKERRIQGAKLLEKVGEHIPGCTKIDPLEDSDFTLLSSF